MDTLQSQANNPSPLFARNACLCCRQRKRKCDKKLPACASCIGKGYFCSYSELEMSSSVFGVRNLADSFQIDNSYLEPENHGQHRLPPIYFLDSGFHRQGDIGIPNPGELVPATVMHILGDLAAIRAMASVYFKTIHTWIPIISKSRFHHHIVSPLSPYLRTDAALLLLGMKLISSSPQETHHERSLYIAAKQYFHKLETAGTLTIQGLQAAILISVYEFGHAIYPSAYFSIGICVRYGTALRLDEAMMAEKSSQSNWVELEEQRRVWWAILALDRLVNLGCPERPLATDDPKLDDPFPIKDAAWDEGVFRPGEISTISTTPRINMGHFGRLVHATYLLGLVLRKIREASSQERLHPESAGQLSRTLEAFIRVSETEKCATQTTVCGESSICYSALFILSRNLRFTEGTSREQSEELQKIDNAIQAAVANTIVSSEIFIQEANTSLDIVSPLSFHWLYLTAVICIDQNRQNPTLESSTVLVSLKRMLKKLDKRWKCAGAYLSIVEAREIIAAHS